MVKKYFLSPGVPSSWADLEHPPLFPVSIALTYITSPVCVASCSSGSPRLLPQPHANHICELVSTISLSLSPSVIRVSGPGPVHPFCGTGLPSPYRILPF